MCVATILVMEKVKEICIRKSIYLVGKKRNVVRVNDVNSLFGNVIILLWLQMEIFLLTVKFY
jgi:hypothetical protein